MYTQIEPGHPSYGRIHGGLLVGLWGCDSIDHNEPDGCHNPACFKYIGEVTPSTPLTMLVTGDRNWTDRATILRTLRMYRELPCHVVHGAARGADTLAGEVAAALKYKVTAVPADWEKFGRAAGPIRNGEMLKYGIDLVLAFHDDLTKSKGTANMVSQARRKHLPVLVFHSDGGTQ